MRTRTRTRTHAHTLCQLIEFGCAEIAAGQRRMRNEEGSGAARSVLGCWVGVRRLSLCLTAPRMVLPKVLVEAGASHGPRKEGGQGGRGKTEARRGDKGEREGGASHGPCPSVRGCALGGGPPRTCRTPRPTTPRASIVLGSWVKPYGTRLGIMKDGKGAVRLPNILVQPRATPHRARCQY